MKRINSFILIALFAIVFNACKKSDTTPTVPNPTNGKTTAVFNPNKTYGTMTDQDGNVYKTIVISTQTWMAENLRTTHYRDGSAIPLVSNNTAWTALTTGAYCNYNNTTNTDTIATFGRLYNWIAATDARNIAPVGWHVPNNTELTTLISYLGGVNAGGKMKEIGMTHWYDSNFGATNESGFTALPAGCHGNTFNGLGSSGYWWSSTADDGVPFAWNIIVNNVDSNCNYIDYKKTLGSSVRCVKD